jgi:multimeric flavodoxin WrbA
VARGIESVPGMRARVRTVPKVAPVVEQAGSAVPPEGAPYVERRDLEECVGLALGSPTRFGNMARPSSTSSTASARVGARHARGQARGGVLLDRHAARRQEATLLSMMLPLLHHGMRGRHSLHRARPQLHALRRLTYRRDARLRHRQRPPVTRRGAARVRARQAARAGREATARDAARAAGRLAACACLIALILLGAAWSSSSRR